MYHFIIGYETNVSSSANDKIIDKVAELNTSKYTKKPSAFISYKMTKHNKNPETGVSSKLPQK